MEFSPDATLEDKLNIYISHAALGINSIISKFSNIEEVNIYPTLSFLNDSFNVLVEIINKKNIIWGVIY